MDMRKKITIVAAARPNFMKIAPIVHALQKEADTFTFDLIHTGQHYDKNMSDTFFEQLEIPKPTLNLGIGKGSHAFQIGHTMIEFEKYALEHKPDMVLVVGDVNATIACALTASKLNIPVGHVEAGLRSFDRTMPEEINRLATDAISDLLFTPSEEASVQLLKEGVPQEKIHFIGNIMIDTLLHQRKKAEQIAFYKKVGLKEKEYILLTMHRPSNVDHPDKLKGLLGAIAKIAQEYAVIWPIHPRTYSNLEKFDLLHYVRRDLYDAHLDLSNKQVMLPSGIFIMKPIGYLEIVNLMDHSKLVLTDSGGIQEETTVLQIPCLTLRDNTERYITVSEGTNYLVGTNPDTLIQVYNEVKKDPKKGSAPKFWDGETSDRLLSVLKKTL